MRYPVVLHTDDHVRYGVTVPDIVGCFSAGDSIDEALVSVQEAIALQLEGIDKLRRNPRSKLYKKKPLL